jgi:phosphatidylglycerol---prolipoprotein diacylglyceryl transferase
VRSTLFYIPHEFAGLPLFGAGWGLIVLAICFATWAVWVYLATSRGADKGAPAPRPLKPTAEILAGLPFWFVAAALIWLILPAIEQTIPGDPPIILGLPIRGYGVMVLIGMLCGISLTTYRGRSLGVSADLIVGLGFWMMIGGVLGARLFYVVQKWDEFADYDVASRLIAIVKLTEGGLVIYGGVIGGIISGAIYCKKHRQPMRAIADLIAPGFLVGLAFGRIGCLLNGCCFGGVCTADLPTIAFPQGSAPYMAQLETGQLLGIEVARNAAGNRQLPSRISEVATASIAEKLGMKEGDTLKTIHPFLLPNTDVADKAASPRVMADVAFNENIASLPSNELPASSLPVQPSQIYASINAALLCWLVWCIQPIPRRDGTAFLIAIILYGFSRFLLEWIRSDEAGQFGTGLSISQLIAIASSLSAALLLLALRNTPPKRVWQWQ